ncbi:MAG: PASTA domain-containing protein [Epsilonproteobacteria bacterium]|nr:PASTA domain-containing protein [Campylobacterota bacterium]
MRTPNVIGKNIYHALLLAQKSRLGLRLAAEREDSVLPEGTVLDQVPRPSLASRVNQDIFLTVSKRPSFEQVPDFWGQEYKQIRSYTRKNDVSLKVIHVQSKYPNGTCIAQYPLPGMSLQEKKMAVCLSVGTAPMHIVPDVRGMEIERVAASLRSFGVQFEKVHTEPVEQQHECHECVVLEQFPLPGSVVDRSKGAFMQLQIKKIV